MQKYYLAILLLLSTLTHAEIIHPSLGGVFMSHNQPNTLNIVSTSGLATVVLGSHSESDSKTTFAPNYSVQIPGGSFYGGDPNTGNLVKYDAAGHTKILHTFTRANDAGTIPTGLIYRNGYIYGEVADINSAYLGSLWKIALDGSHFTILHKFTNTGDGYNPTGLMTMDDQGNIYGTASASIYRIDNSDHLTILSTQFASIDLAYRNGYLYGSGIDGSGYGFLYKIKSIEHDILDPDTFVDIHDFTSTDVMSTPRNLLLSANGKIYGITDDGYSLGRHGLGHIFSIDANDKIKLEYSFHGYSDGTDPIAIVFERNGTTMHGITRYGGPDNLGAVFTLQTQIDNKPNNYVLFTTEYLPRNEYQVGPTVMTTVPVEIMCMPSGTFYKLQESQAIVCPSAKDNAVYFGRNVSNIPTQTDYIAATAAVAITAPINDNLITPVVQSALKDQQSMLVSNVDKYDVLTFIDLNAMQDITQRLKSLLHRSGLLGAHDQLLTNLSQAQQISKFKNLTRQVNTLLQHNYHNNQNGDTYAVGRYLNNASSTGSGSITNNTPVPLDVMCVPEHKRYLIPPNTSMYCQQPNANNSDGASGVYIGYNVADGTDISRVVSATINYARGADFGTIGSQDAWSNLSSGHSLYLRNFSNYARLVVSGNPNGSASQHCPAGSTYYSRLSSCFLMYYDTSNYTWPVIASGRLFFSTLGSEEPDPPNFTKVSAKNFFTGTHYGYYSNFSMVGYSFNIVNDSYSTTGQSLVVNQISGNTEFNKIPPTYLQDNTKNKSGVTTLCEPSNSFQHNMPNIQTIPKYSQAKIWVATILTELGGLILALMILTAIMLAILATFANPGLGAMAFMLGSAIIFGGALATGGYFVEHNMSGQTVTKVTLPAVGSVCYANDKRLYEGTFSIADAWGGEKALVNYAKTNLKYFGQVNMGNATSFDGSGQVTTASTSYVNQITGFNNLTNHIISKNAAKNGIYYKGY
ncbi:MAG: hypothetical protein RL017_824 [Pseudomonadota bacterium]